MYCHDGTCIDRPTLVVESAEDRRADLGVPYTPPAFLRRVTVYGRPGASGTLETIRRGCPPITLTSPIVLDGAGIFTETEAPTTPATDCADERIGLYQYRATVDGVATDSEHRSSTTRFVRAPRRGGSRRCSGPAPHERRGAWLASSWRLARSVVF
jgi:hypothetical protein